jgi:general secretion pathway protein B
MSYILEALKKAQAERQLGSAPTIHDLSIQAAPQERARGVAVPLWAVASGGAVLLAAAAFLWWRQNAPAPVPAAVAAVQVAVAPVMPPPVVQVQNAAPHALPAAPVPAAPPALAAPLPAPSRTPLAAPPAPQVAATPAPKPVAAPKPAVVAALAPAPEENLPMVRELPQSVQQGLPQVAFGGYMYSNNPADRLLLIDKVLRHEGEEVAPGLVLEKLLPRAAVLNFRGTRYRVPY